MLAENSLRGPVAWRLEDRLGLEEATATLTSPGV